MWLMMWYKWWWYSTVENRWVIEYDCWCDTHKNDDDDDDDDDVNDDQHLPGVLDTYCIHNWPSSVHSLCIGVVNVSN